MTIDDYEMDEKRNIAKAAGKTSAGTIVSRVTGLIREIVITWAFGATGITDAFFVAFRIPNLLREFFAEGSVSAGFVPVFTEYLTKEGKEEAKRLAGIVFAFLLSVLIIVCLAGIIFAPYIVAVFAPGFKPDPEKFSLTVKLTRIMFPFLLFISLAALAMGMLNSLRSFFIPAIAPASFNLAIIASIVFIAPEFAVPILAVGLGVTLGGALQYGTQLLALIKWGYNVKPVFSFVHKGFRKIIVLVIPVAAAMGVVQINVLISTIFASYLYEGSVTYLYLGYRLLNIPVGIFIIAVSTAMLPSLSRQAAVNDIDALRDTFSFSMRLVFFFTLPAMAGLIVLSEPIVNVLFQRGGFDYNATRGTVYALIFYSTGLWAFAGFRTVRTTFYALQDTRTPLKIALLSVLINTLFCALLFGPLKHGGLAFALAISAAFNFLMLFILLRKKLKRVNGRSIIRSFIRTSFASAVMGFVGFYVVNSFTWMESGELLKKAGILVSTIVLCIAVYLSIMHLMKSEELKYIIKMRKKS